MHSFIAFFNASFTDFFLCSFGHILTLTSYFMFLIGIVLPFNEKNEMAKVYVDPFFGNVTKLNGFSYNSQIAKKSYSNSVYTMYFGA